MASNSSIAKSSAAAPPSTSPRNCSPGTPGTPGSPSAAGLPPPAHHTDADPAEFLDLYARLISRDAADWEVAASLLDEGFSKEFFEQKCAKVNASLKKTLGLAATPYLITRQGKRPLSRHGLTLDAKNILWE